MGDVLEIRKARPAEKLVKPPKKKVAKKPKAKPQLMKVGAHPVVEAIVSGLYDDMLKTIADAVKSRHEIRRTIRSKVIETSVGVGTYVRIVEKVTPDYFKGTVAKVTGVDGVQLRVQISKDQNPKLPSWANGSRATVPMGACEIVNFGSQGEPGSSKKNFAPKEGK